MAEQVGTAGESGFVEALRQIAARSSQMEVARKSGVDSSTISRMLSGERMGHMATVMRLIEAYPELRGSFVPQNFPNCKS